MKNIKKSSFNSTLAGFIVLAGLVAVLGIYTCCLHAKVAATNQKIEEMKASFAQKLADNSKIYTYNLEEVVAAMNIAEKKQQYEASIMQLNNELTEAENKIKTLKDAKVKEDFTEVYLKNIKMKRDEIVGNYEKSMQEITMKLNRAMEDVVREKNLPTVFYQNTMAIKTPHMVDVTADVLQKFKN